MTNGLEALTQVLETVPKAYDDVLSPPAKEFGKTLALIPRTVNAALLPLQKWLMQREYSLAETEKLLSEKLKNIDPEKIVTPEPYVAVPALQAISYSMDDYQLRNLYANLLANSMDADTKAKVHPAFVETIKQLSPLDAQVFQHIYTHEINPLIHLKQSFSENGGFNILAQNITLINFAPVKEVAISIDNLSRLNLIEVPSDGYYTQDTHYNPFYNLDIYKYCEEIISNRDSSELTVDKKVIQKTEIGRVFYNICAKDK